MKNNHTAQPSVAIILLNYCNWRDTIRCLESLRNINYANYEIIIVDNNSPDDSFDILKKHETETISVISSKKNGGFAYGNNVGIKHAIEKDPKYCLLLNNDTVVESDFLSIMIKTAETRKADITTCRIMYDCDREKVWYAGGSVDWPNLRAIHDSLNTYEYCKEIREVEFISGCCMLINSRCFDLLGLLPEEYFMYYEDLDYCITARKHGCRLIYNPDSVIYHSVSAASGGGNSPFVIEWANRSRRLFFARQKECIPRNKRYYSMHSELRTIASIVKSGSIYYGLKAYIKSFRKQDEVFN